MRHSTKNMETALTVTVEADARLANRVNALRSWIANVVRHVEERRAQAIADINQASDSMVGELKSLDLELIAVHEELVGDDEVKQSDQSDKAPEPERSEVEKEYERAISEFVRPAGRIVKKSSALISGDVLKSDESAHWEDKYQAEALKRARAV